MKEFYKVIIAGSRTFYDFELLTKIVDYVLYEKIQTHTIVIISGLAKGTDTLGLKYADLKEFETIKMPAIWKYPNGEKNYNAGMERNQEMLNICDGTICFWDGKSTGTQHMFIISQNANKPTFVFNYTEYYKQINKTGCSNV